MKVSAQTQDKSQEAEIKAQMQKLDAQMQKLNAEMEKLNQKLENAKNSTDEDLAEELNDAREDMKSAKEDLNEAMQELQEELGDDKGNNIIVKDTVIRIRKKHNGIPPTPPTPPTAPSTPTPPTPPAPGNYEFNFKSINMDSIMKSVNLDSIMRHMPNVDSLVRQVKWKTDSMQRQMIIINSANGSTRIITDSSKKRKTIIITDDGVNIRFKDRKGEEMRHHQNVKTRWIGVDFGISTLTQNGNFSPKGVADDLSVKPWPSRYWRLYVFQQGINLDRHKLYLVYGLNFDFYRYSFKNMVSLAPNRDSFSYIKETPNIKYSHLNTGYLEVPLMLYFETNPYHRHRSFKVGLGGYGGVLLYGNTRLYTDGGSTVNRGPFPMNDFKYGLQAQIGYGPLQFFAKYSLSPLFETDKYAPELNTATFGIRLLNDFHWGRYL